MIVLDASVWVSVLRSDDRHHGESWQWSLQWSRAGYPIVIPALFLSEVSGAIARQSGESSLGDRALADLLRDPSFDIRPIATGIATEAARIAALLRLRGADALYVALASELGLPLVTWDRELHQRAARLVATTTPHEVWSIV